MTTKAQWETLLNESAKHHAAGRQSRAEAGRYLWLGAKAAIKTWRPSTDPTAERLYRRCLLALGGARKGCASKIAAVARAAVAYGLDLDAYGSLGAAYEAAQRMAHGSETDLPPVCPCPHCPGNHATPESDDQD